MGSLTTISNCEFRFTDKKEHCLQVFQKKLTTKISEMYIKPLHLAKTTSPFFIVNQDDLTLSSLQISPSPSIEKFGMSLLGPTNTC